MGKQIQIDSELFRDICDYFFSDEAPSDFQADIIRKELEKKIDKIIARELFSRYKRQPTGDEREAARKAYLDHIGLHRDYRTESEYSAPEPPSE